MVIIDRLFEEEIACSTFPFYTSQGYICLFALLTENLHLPLQGHQNYTIGWSWNAIFIEGMDLYFEGSKSLFWVL